MAAQATGSGKGDTGARLAQVRDRMRKHGIDALLVRATDRYLNEYVPAAGSLRIWLTGFTGSVGDAVVTLDRAFLFVDGRYHLQAETEVDPGLIEVVKLSLGTSIEEAVRARLAELAAARPGLTAGFEAEKVPVELARRLREAVEKAGGKLVAPPENLVELARGGVPPLAAAPLEAVPDEVAGEPVAGKLSRVRAALAGAGLDGLVVTRLDELAWLTNLRAYGLDYQSTFPGLGYVASDRAILFVDPAALTAPARAALAGFELAPEQGWPDELRRRLEARRPGRVGLDPSGSTEAVREALARAVAPGEVVEGASPVAAMKARKNPVELRTMADSFRRADAVVAASAAWLNRELTRGRPVTEAGFAAHVEERFRAAGARGLSFRVIAAAGANGAVIHYSHPDRERRIRKGELMLLDTGAYFEAGYATDLTRTFLAGGASAKPTARQKTIYTLVLKASIRGLAARFPAGTTGVQLDAIVRAPIWEAGYDFLHGTGHGVGILVHESPPRVATRSTTPLEPGMVFSIEPGIYLAGWGGVRIENLATVVEDPKVEGFLRVEPLTFAPIDRRLVEPRLLAVEEKRWLRQYQRRGKTPGKARR